jgi:hypothetical protein
MRFLPSPPASPHRAPRVVTLNQLTPCILTLRLTNSERSDEPPVKPHSPSHFQCLNQPFSRLHLRKGWLGTHTHFWPLCEAQNMDPKAQCIRAAFFSQALYRPWPKEGSWGLASSMKQVGSSQNCFSAEISRLKLPYLMKKTRHLEKCWLWSRVAWDSHLGAQTSHSRILHLQQSRGCQFQHTLSEFHTVWKLNSWLELAFH